MNNEHGMTGTPVELLVGRPLSRRQLLRAAACAVIAGPFMATAGSIKTYAGATELVVEWDEDGVTTTAISFCHPMPADRPGRFTCHRKEIGFEQLWKLAKQLQLPRLHSCDQWVTDRGVHGKAVWRPRS